MNAQFVLSAASAADFPQTGIPEVALVGRSNVGKSSLINALVKRQVARTSAAPGKTRLVNYYLVELPTTASKARRDLYLVDLPGYGYARGGPESANAFQQLTTEYFDHTRTRRRIMGVLHLIDSRHPDLPQDGEAHDWLANRRLPTTVVATKIDKLTRAEQARAMDLLRNRYGAVVPVSSQKGLGVDQIWRAITGWVKQ